MVNETTNATVTRLPSAAIMSRPGPSQGVGRPSVGGDNLPVEGNKQPQSGEKPVDIREAVSQVNDFVQKVQRDLAFNMDEASGRTVIKVINRDSGDVIRQIPTEEVLAIASQIRSALEDSVDGSEVPTGLLFSKST